MASTLTAPRTESAAPSRMTWGEFLDFDYKGQAEWVDGEVVFEMVTNTHAVALNFLSVFMRLFCVAWLVAEDAAPLKCVAEVVGWERLLALLD